MREVERLALVRGDVKVTWTAGLVLGRMALGEGRFDVAETALQPLAFEWFGDGRVDAQAPVETEPELPRALKVQFLLSYSLLLAHRGEQKLARDRLKRAHALLDSKDYEKGELEGWSRVSLELAPARSNNDHCGVD